MLRLTQQTVMRLDGAELTNAEAVALSLNVTLDMRLNGSKRQAKVADSINSMLVDKKYVIEHKDGDTRILFRDYDVPETDDDFGRYCIDFYAEGSELSYAVKDQVSGEAVDFGSFTVAELRLLTNVHLGADCCVK